MTTETVKKHGNVGNSNAKKDIANDAQIYIRCPSSFKNKLVKVAQKDNKKLSEWIICTLENAINKDIKNENQ